MSAEVAFFHACPSAECHCFEPPSCPECGTKMVASEVHAVDEEGPFIRYEWACYWHGAVLAEKGE